MNYYLNNSVERIKFSREAAGVERCHATHGLGPRSVGLHSFNMLTMLLILYPNASKNLMKAVIEHDIPERLIGDIPHPSKKLGMTDKEAIEKAENHLTIQVFGSDSLNELSQAERDWKAGLDILEYYCYLKDERMLGNRRVEAQIQYTQGYMTRNRGNYPPEIVDAFYLIRSSAWETLPDMDKE